MLETLKHLLTLLFGLSDTKLLALVALAAIGLSVYTISVVAGR